MEKELFKRLILEYQQLVVNVELTPRDISLSDNFNYVLVGLRRAGKSYLLYQQVQHLIHQGHSAEEILYFNFEDDRLHGLTLQDLDTIKVCYEELFSHTPIFFLDEIQNVTGWEHFARRLADQKYRVYITGSNARMLSMEIAGTLGGRYMIQGVLPYSFKEYLTAGNIRLQKNWMYSPQRTEIVRMFDAYFHFGGLPEVQPIELLMKRQWLNNLYNKIFFGDILARFNIRNTIALKVLIQKLAESVKQPCSFTRLANIVSSTGKKTRVETIADYLEYTAESCLIFSIENYAAKIVEKVSNKKFYFMDNGLLNLFLFDPETSLLENIVAIRLYSQYSDLCFFNDGFEVDFYLWEHSVAIQVSYSLADANTRNREVDGLCKLARRYDINRMFIITKDEEDTIEANGHTIEVIPVWKWLLE
ncbi:MAG: ATP-binding protein [Paraprevotella sp.]|nr:ATP-binding protein [Paraprevotella sp.]